MNDSNFRKLLTENSVDALLLSSSSNIAYITNYFGFSDIEREAYLLLTKKENFLFTDGRYTEAVRHLQGFSLQEIKSTEPFTKLLKDLIQTYELQIIGIEEQDLSVKEYLAITKLVTTVKPLSLRMLRMIKTPQEIKKIRKACEIADAAFATVLKKIREGITEKEIGNLLAFEIKKQHADISFRPIVAFNEHAAIPHHMTSDRKLTTNSLLLMDFGALYKGYSSDMTRTIVFGKPTEEQKKVYQMVLDAQQKAVDGLNKELRIKHYGKASSADKTAREYIESQGYPTIPHSLGHGIGIQVHEAPSLSPTSKDKLEDGMVFSIEQGIYLPGKLGVRIEDLFAIQKGELTQLTHAPNTLQHIS